MIEVSWVEDDALLKTIVDMDDQRLDGIEEREAKRQNNIETSHLEENRLVQASENTNQVLLQRELLQRQNDEMDAGLLMKGDWKNVNEPTDKGLIVIGDRIEAVTKVGDREEADKVKLSNDDMGENEDYEVYEERNGEDVLAEEGTLRCSGGFANKNNEDIPMMDRAKNLAAARNLDPSEGMTQTVPTILNIDDTSLLSLAEKVGVSLGISVDMVENNLKLIRAQEQDRLNIFHQNKNKKYHPWSLKM
jgi:hypothetical protein